MSRRAQVALGVVALCTLAVGGAGCALEADVPPRACCATCDQAPQLVSAFDCDGDMQSPQLCPQRSTCALGAFVGDGPAICCVAGCDDGTLRSSASARCNKDERYLHECPAESACYQSWRASLLGATFEPFVAADAAVGGAIGAAWQSASGALWVVGSSGQALRRSSAGWVRFDTGVGEPLTSIWGAADDEIWAAGFNGTLLRFDGKRWSRVKVERPAGAAAASRWHINALWGSGPDDVWAVGSAGTALRFDGARWTPYDVPTTSDLTSVWGGGPRDVWAVGAAGAIVHFDGDAWRAQKSPTDVHLLDVWGRYAVGQSGTILARDDGVDGKPGAWRRVASPTRLTLTGVGGGRRPEQGRDEVFVAGLRGLVLRRTVGGAFEPLSYYNVDPTRDLLDVSYSASRVVVVGERGAVFMLAR